VPHKNKIKNQNLIKTCLSEHLKTNQNLIKTLNEHRGKQIKHLKKSEFPLHKIRI